MRSAASLVGCILSMAILTSPLRGQTNEEINERVSAILPKLEKIASRYRIATHTPGLAVAVITPDNVYYLSSGRRSVSSRAKVGECTVFQVASVSKPITGTYAARLVTEGRLRWDDRISDLLPWFSFASPEVTRQVTVLDMLTQRSGLLAGTGNILEDLGDGRRTVLESMRFIDPAPRFRKTWAYANFGITLGGVAAAKTTPWEFPASISDTLFRPLSMLSTSASHRRFVRQKNRAQMNYVLDGVAQPIFTRDAQAQAPAGGVSSNAEDLALLLQMYLNNGVADGKEFLSPAVLRKTISPITFINGPFDDGSSVYYGVGWFVRIPKSGPRTVFHSGTFVGSRTLLSFRPEQKIGIVVLGNAAPGLPPEAVESAFYQLYETDRVKPDTLRKAQKELPPSSFTVLNQVLKSPITLDPLTQGHPLPAFAGTYANEYLGRFVISQTGNGLSLSVGPHESPLPLRLNTADRNLYVLNKSGDWYRLDFQNLTDGKFMTLHVPGADDVGWGVLQRVK